MMPDYSVGKAAMLSLSRQFAEQHADEGVMVNAVCPGPTASDLWMAQGGLLDQSKEAAGHESREEALKAADTPAEPTDATFAGTDAVLRASGVRSGAVEPAAFLVALTVFPPRRTNNPRVRPAQRSDRRSPAGAAATERAPRQV